MKKRIITVSLIVISLMALFLIGVGLFKNRQENLTFKHQVSSRETFADGAIEVAVWTEKQACGLYNMDDFCNDIIG